MQRQFYAVLMTDSRDEHFETRRTLRYVKSAASALGITGF